MKIADKHGAEKALLLGFDQRQNIQPVADNTSMPRVIRLIVHTFPKILFCMPACPPYTENNNIQDTI
jgi:hypothetical protein